MARPQKRTVEYFSHPVAHGKVVYVLEQAYGNDGYAFWFKLQETLGETPKHYINCNIYGAWEHLLSKVRLPSERAETIMGTLANMEAIDRELWEKRQVVWSDDFVRDLKPVYDKRRVPLPMRPEELLLHPVNDIENTLLSGLGGRKPTGVGLGGIKEGRKEGSKGRKEEEGGGLIPDILLGLELYENNIQLLKNFTRNYNNWKKTFPDLDIDHEIRKAHSWEIDNPKRQKNDKARFLGGWLRGEDDKRGKEKGRGRLSREEKVREMGEETE